MTIEQKLRELIVSRYDNVSIFTKAIGIPNSTFASIMQRGIMNSNISSVYKVCRALHISIDKLCEGEIINTSDLPEPEPVEIRTRVESLCTDLRTRDRITIDGEPLSDNRKNDIALLLNLLLTYVRTSSE